MGIYPETPRHIGTGKPLNLLEQKSLLLKQHRHPNRLKANVALRPAFPDLQDIVLLCTSTIVTSGAGTEQRLFGEDGLG